MYIYIRNLYIDTMILHVCWIVLCWMPPSHILSGRPLASNFVIQLYLLYSCLTLIAIMLIVRGCHSLSFIVDCELTTIYDRCCSCLPNVT